MSLATVDKRDFEVNSEVASFPLIAFAGGGTGGHLYPALAIAEALEKMVPEVRFVFFGTNRDIDKQILGNAERKLVPQTVLPLTLNPLRVPAFLRAWKRSMRNCRNYFEKDMPSVVIGSGGFASGPAICCACNRKIPTALVNPDLIPGRANRYLSSRVDTVFAQWPETARYLGKRVSVESFGCPVRSDFSNIDQDAIRSEFGLADDCKTLLITGASQGAHSLNIAFVHLACDLAEAAGWQVLHLTGKDDLGLVRDAYQKAGVRGRCVAYTEQMASAMAGADLIVSRAGASSVAEITAVGKPALFLPYPYHKDQHQQANAEMLTRRGTARICADLKDGKLTAEALKPHLRELMFEPGKLEHMSEQAERCKRSDAAEKIAYWIAGKVEKTAG